GVLEARLKQIADEWCLKWCVPGTRAGLRMSPAEYGLPSAPGPRTWTLPGDAVRLSLTTRSAAIVGRAMLGLKRAPAGKAEADLSLLEALEGRSVADFAEMISSLVPECRGLMREATRPAFAPPLDGPGARGVILSLELKPAGALFDLFIRFDLACAARRALAGRAGPPRRLGNLGDALGGQEVSVSARAGRGSLTLAEFSGLSEGDVLILDRTLASGLEVIVNDRAISGARCELEEGASGLTLRIVGDQHAG
ncbi:MAG: FliM/FliN family flagellar motor C-terminal domain-containing protein, partial [Hyphomonas sp.]|nr:FliM/FliN family flagellar motor C-terminal domain-containing protein [Hyphomonas sp.]